MSAETRDQQNKRLVCKLLLLLLGAVLFTIALVPLYNVFCEWTGLNGKTSQAANLAVHKIDQDRWVTVEFTGNTMPGLAWNFAPDLSSVRVHPGQLEMVMFTAKNNTNEAVIGRAVPSVTPGKASLYFKKIECFCFTEQALKAGETRSMPVRFYVSADLPKDIEVLTLSYAFYKAT